MNDLEKEQKLKKYALGVLYCWIFMLFISIAFSKEYGQYFLFTILLLYSIFYVIIYRKISNSYENSDKRLLAFGQIARGTFIGVMYYLSMFFSIIIGSLLTLTFFSLIFK